MGLPPAPPGVLPGSGGSGEPCCSPWLKKVKDPARSKPKSDFPFHHGWNFHCFQAMRKTAGVPQGSPIPDWAPRKAKSSPPFPCRRTILGIVLLFFPFPHSLKRAESFTWTRDISKGLQDTKKTFPFIFINYILQIFFLLREREGGQTMRGKFLVDNLQYWATNCRIRERHFQQICYNCYQLRR